MINLYLNNLRFRLSMRKIPNEQADQLLIKAKQEIDEEVRSLVEEAVNKVTSYAEDIDAEEFLNQIRLSDGTGAIEITTDSGTLDFSTPPLPMLPWLLNNGKTAKDGSTYKVIPVGKKESKNKTLKDTKSGLRAIRKTTSMEDIAANIASSFNGGAVTTSKQVDTATQSGEQVFRTASSKQDSSSSWMIPPKERDMTSIVLEVNAHLRDEINSIVSKIILKYEREADDVLYNG